MIHNLCVIVDDTWSDLIWPDLYNPKSLPIKLLKNDPKWTLTFQTEMWKQSKIWAIEYQDGDIVGKLLCHVSMISVILPFVTLGVFFHSKSRSALKLFFGQIFATLFARAVKLMVQSPRPDAGHLVHPGNSGFPSDHSLSGKFWTWPHLTSIWPRFDLIFSCLCMCIYSSWTSSASNQTSSIGGFFQPCLALIPYYHYDFESLFGISYSDTGKST